MIGRLAFTLLAPVRRIAGVWRTTRRTAACVPDLVEAVLVLPHISQQLEVIRFQTATLLEMREEIERVRGDTAALAQVALPLQDAALRIGRAADRVPARRVRPRP